MGKSTIFTAYARKDDLRLMSDDPRQQPVVIDHRIELEALATLRVEVFTTSISGLRQALQENRPEIILTPPAWWPSALCAIFALYALAIVAYQGIITFKGLTNGYNVESCQEIVVKGVKLSNCLKLTKPK